ncbi:MAG TPA: hypothetical protein VN581_06440 [Patescibacteria group bacterium]|nr:hypothetical protein [Patescibacteria group bacterium]
MSEEQWYVVTFGDMLHWARLTVNEDSTAQVFSANGETEHFPDEDAARAALLDANYRAFDGIDDDDADLMGFELDSVAPPHTGVDASEEDDEDLLEQMTMKLAPR